MKVKDALRMLLDLPPEEEIILAFWRREDAFNHISQENWDAFASDVEYDMDWSRTHDGLDWQFDSFINQHKQDDY